MRAGGNTAKQIAELDFRLHVTLAEATQNELFKVLLAPLIDQLHDQIILTREEFPHLVDLVFDQHEAIVAAVEKGDPEAARQAGAGKTQEFLAYIAENGIVAGILDIVCSSSDSRTPARRPSIVGRIPILGREPSQRLGATVSDINTSSEE